MGQATLGNESSHVVSVAQKGGAARAWGKSKGARGGNKHFMAHASPGMKREITADGQRARGARRMKTCKQRKLAAGCGEGDM